LDDSLFPAHAFLGWVHVLIGEHEKGIAHCERAIEMAPSSGDAHSLFAQVLNYSGRPEEAVGHNEKAFRLNPIRPNSFYYAHAQHTFTLMGRYEEGAKISREGLIRYPDNVPLLVRLAIIYAAWRRENEATKAAQDVLRVDPKFSAKRFAQTMPYRDPALKAKMLELMGKAGLPE